MECQRAIKAVCPLALVLFPLFAGAIPPAGDEPSARKEGSVSQAYRHRREADAAYRARDYAASVHHLTSALSLIPDHPSILLNLARAHALLGDGKQALRLLDDLAQMGLTFTIDTMDDFASIRGTAEFNLVLEKFKRNKAPLVRSTRSFSIDEKGLIGEGLAYDPVGRTFFISSVRKRKILSINAGTVMEFAGRTGGLWSVLGMRVDAKRRLLWAVTTAAPQMEGFDKEDEGKSAVLKFDLRNGVLLKTYAVPDRSKRHWLGDLTVTSNGDVFASDSVSPAVYVVRSQRDEMELFLDGARFGSLQGIAFSDDEKHFYLADYSSGIYTVNVETRNVVHLAPLPHTTLLGIDGLYFFKGDLIAVQNGVNPPRVLRIAMGRDRRIEKVTVIESNNPMFEEPTLGVIVGRTFHFIANSQWDLVDDNGRVTNQNKLSHLIVLKMEF